MISCIFIRFMANMIKSIIARIWSQVSCFMLGKQYNGTSYWRILTTYTNLSKLPYSMSIKCKMIYHWSMGLEVELKFRPKLILVVYIWSLIGRSLLILLIIAIILILVRLGTCGIGSITTGRKNWRNVWCAN